MKAVENGHNLTDRLERWMRIVGEAGFDGWLVADFRRNNPLLARLLGLHSGILTRRSFLWLPAHGKGEPHVFVSRTDGHAISSLECPRSLYGGFDEMVETLRRLLPANARVAMEYVELGTLPTVSRVDAGLVELVRSLGVTVQSSGALIAALEVWDERQAALHKQAARGVDEARRLALEHCTERLRADEDVTEGMIVQRIRSYFDEHGLESADGPDVGAGVNSADPHYGSGDGAGAVITPDTVLLLDIWAQVRDASDAPYADITWMAFTGSSPPQHVVTVYDAVQSAREAAVALINLRVASGQSVTGREIDREARTAIIDRGLDEFLIHRTGHSLGIDHVQGMGTNLDDVEFPDDRPLLFGSGFTVEPGLYLPGQFGMRSEVSAILLPTGVHVTTEAQQSLTLLLR
ncbi:MAG: M24 family metallopeptidase [Chloroflexota bacterium]